MCAYNILISPVGNKTPLIKILKEVLDPFGGQVIGLDMDSEAPGAMHCDEFHMVPPADSPDYFNYINTFIKKYDISLIIPMGDHELGLWSQKVDEGFFNIPVAISSQEALEICNDKHKTHHWLEENGFSTIATYTLNQIEEVKEKLKFPVFAKDPVQDATKHFKLVYDAAELSNLPKDWLIQESFKGEAEFTINAYVDRKGEITTIIPHRRIEIEDGAVSRGITLKDDVLIELARRVISQLPKLYGPLNIQVFYDPQKGLLKIFDINLRFGGGYPLPHHAGGNFFEWLIKENINSEEIEPLESFKEGVRLKRNHDKVEIYV